MRVAPVGSIFGLIPPNAWARGRFDFFGDVDSSHDVFLPSIFVGLILFATTVALLHLAGRRRAQVREATLVAELERTTAELDRAEAFLSAEPQITIAWRHDRSDPDIAGEMGLVGKMIAPQRVLGFGSWLPPTQARALDARVEGLRERGEPFLLSVVSLAERHLEVEGRAVGGRAVMRIREVGGEKLEAARLGAELMRMRADLEMFRTLLDAIPCPTWTRDGLGKLTWVNAAYARAVDAKTADEAATRGTELLESPAREAAAARRAGGEVYRGRTAAVMAGWRRSLDVVDLPKDDRSIGIAFDVSETEAARVDLQRMAEAHARTLDQLSTAVAIFDRRKQLVFYNAAYRDLWGFERSDLDQRPTEPEILDALRARRMLPEQADFRAWKESHLAGYQSLEPDNPYWFLPDGRTLRVLINPNPQNGVTYLFDDVTAHVHLESRFNAQTRVQRETLDTLKEGVAVFGTDGRLKLSNAAFARLWKLDGSVLDGRPHIEEIAEACATLAPGPEAWITIKTAVAGFHDQRTGIEQRLACRNGTIVDCTAAPLPDGATLLTFTDTTASVNVERALTERNQALLETEQLRDDFVHHVSFQLRSPLTNIIGFIQLLGDGSVGSLNPKQSEYVGYVMKSAAALLAIIDDILDLATIDTGALELDLTSVDVQEVIGAAAEGVQDRLEESALRLQVVVLPGIGSFVADEKRLRQILFNLLSNAIGFSAPGQTVTLAALRRSDEMVFKVSDQGRGIPEDVMQHVFDRFHSNTMGSRHRGVGLGLSIVKSFVELHGGRILVDSAPGLGTTVTCIFPTHDEKLESDEQDRETD